MEMEGSRLKVLGVLLAACLYVTSSAANDSQHPCSCPGFSLKVLSTRNNTGHWSTRVEVDRGNGAAHNGHSLPYSVEVNQTTESEDGIGRVFATVHVKPTGAGNVLEGYELVPGLGYYRFHTELVLWEDARLACVAEGSHLAIPSSAEETRVLVGLFSKRPHTHTDQVLNNWAHIGLHDLHTEGQYITVFGEPMSYADWNLGEPNNAGGDPGEDCLCINRAGKMNDCSCTYLLPYFCEKELGD